MTVKGFELPVLWGNKVELVPYENIMHYKNIHQGIFSGKSKKFIHIQYEVQSLQCLKSIFSHISSPLCYHYL